MDPAEEEGEEQLSPIQVQGDVDAVAEAEADLYGARPMHGGGGAEEDGMMPLESEEMLYGSPVPGEGTEGEGLAPEGVDALSDDRLVGMLEELVALFSQQQEQGEGQGGAEEVEEEKEERMRVFLSQMLDKLREERERRLATEEQLSALAAEADAAIADMREREAAREREHEDTTMLLRRLQFENVRLLGLISQAKVSRSGGAKALRDLEAENTSLMRACADAEERLRLAEEEWRRREVARDDVLEQIGVMVCDAAAEVSALKSRVRWCETEAADVALESAQVPQLKSRINQLEDQLRLSQQTIAYHQHNSHVHGAPVHQSQHEPHAHRVRPGAAHPHHHPEQHEDDDGFGDAGTREQKLGTPSTKSTPSKSGGPSVTFATPDSLESVDSKGVGDTPVGGGEAGDAGDDEDQPQHGVFSSGDVVNPWARLMRSHSGPTGAVSKDDSALTPEQRRRSGGRQKRGKSLGSTQFSSGEESPNSGRRRPWTASRPSLFMSMFKNVFARSPSSSRSRDDAEEDRPGDDIEGDAEPGPASPETHEDKNPVAELWAVDDTPAPAEDGGDGGADTGTEADIDTARIKEHSREQEDSGKTTTSNDSTAAADDSVKDETSTVTDAENSEAGTAASNASQDFKSNSGGGAGGSSSSSNGGGAGGSSSSSNGGGGSGNGEDRKGLERKTSSKKKKKSKSRKSKGSSPSRQTSRSNSNSSATGQEESKTAVATTDS